MASENRAAKKSNAAQKIFENSDNEK